MDIDIRVFPWTRYKTLFDEGKLRDEDFLRSDENKDLWYNSPKFSDKAGDSYILYQAVYNDTSFFSKLGFEKGHPYLKFCNDLLNEEFRTDLKLKGNFESVVAVIAPERTNRLADLAAQVDFDEVRKAHQRLGSEGVDFGYGELVQVGVEIGTDEYIDYIQALVNFVTEASRCDDSCLVIDVG